MGKIFFKKEILSNSPQDTEKIGRKFAEHIISKRKNCKKKEAVVVSLEGELGCGKTTFVKGFSNGLKIKDMTKSPTFVIMKKYKLGIKLQSLGFLYFYHFDCYRIGKIGEMLELDFEELILSPVNILAIEWGDIINEILPKRAVRVNFKFVDDTKRKIFSSL